jgi:hypothetical protein
MCPVARLPRRAARKDESPTSQVQECLSFTNERLRLPVFQPPAIFLPTGIKEKMKPAKLNRLRIFLAGQHRLNHNSRFAIHDLRRKCGFLLAAAFVLSVFASASFAQVTLGTSPYTQNFNGIGSGLPTGWTVRTGATASALGTSQTLTTTATAWSSSTGQFDNVASTNGATSADSAATQAANTDRALGVRQTGAFGDPGAAFVLQLSNTSGLTSFSLSFKLIEVDPTITAGRTTTWNVDYGFGTTPSSFTNATTSPATITTTQGSGWGTTTVTVNFGSALDNSSGNVWIRIATKAATSGAGTRPHSGIDDFSLSYSATSPNITTSVSSLPNFGSVQVGNNSSEQNYTVSGTNLTANITVNAPTDFQVSTTGSGVGFGSSVTLIQAGGLVNAQTVYVRFAPGSTGAKAGNITHDSAGATQKLVAVSGTGTAALASEPTIQASGVNFTSVGQNSLTVNWTNGNGTSRIVLAKQGVAVDSNPSDGSSYTANSAFGSGSQIGSGNFVVFSGSGNSVSVTGLAGGTTYHFAVYEFNGSSGAENYLTTTPATGNQATLVATYSWTGGSGDWQVAANWSPTRTIPAATDILQFNGGGTITVTNVPVQTLAQLSVSNSTLLTLQASGGNTLTISGATGPDLSVASGSELNASGASALTIAVGTGATGSISGSMSFAAAAHRLTAADASGITFQSGSVFTATGTLSGAAFGTTNLLSIVFASGSTYVGQSATGPFGAAQPNSVVVFQGGSSYRQETTSTPSFSGRNYANFEMNVAGTVSVTGGAAVTLDNLTITQGTFNFNMTGTPGHAIKGNISVASGQTLNFNPASAGTVNLSGTVAQTISGSGTLTFAANQTVAINNSAGVLLNRNITLDGTLALTLGDLSTTDFTLTQNGSSTGTGDVIGRVHRDDLSGTAKPYGNPNVQISVAGTTITSLEVYLTKNGTTPASFPSAVQRFYSIDPGPGTLGTATVRLHYLDSELNLNTGSSLHLWHATGPSGGSALWSDQGAPTNSATASDPNNWIENNNVTTFSTWALAPGSPPGPGPSAVKLTKFNAASFTDGVQLTWESGFEVNNLGYRLYREQNGKRTRVTPSIVAGSTLLVGQGNRMTAGYSYSWFDPQGTSGTAYYLEALDLDSSRQTYGPVYPYGGSRNGVSPKRERALLLNELGKSLASNSGGGDTTGWPASMSATARSESLQLKPQTLAAQQAIAGGKAVKLQVRQTGWYRVTQPELVAAGFDPASDARLLQLYVDGQEVPVRLSGEGARLNANDALEFYGVALDTQTTDTRTYWLVNGTSAGQRISAKRGKIKPGDQNWTDSPGLRSFAFTAERREKLIYSPRLLNGDGENIFGALIFSDPTEQTLPVKNFDREATTPVQLEVALQGLTAQGHEVHIMLNGADLGNMTFAASAHSTATFAVNRALLHEGDNTVSLASANGDSDISFVDYVRLTYAHQYTADNNALRFSVPGGGVVRVDGFSTANIRVIDISDPNSPLELATAGSPAGAGYSIKIQALGNDTRTLIAFADDLPAHPASITANSPSTWNASTNGADLVIITHKDFRQAIEPLATLRRNQGLSVAVVDVEDVYDEFSYGAHTPAAIKAFLMNAAGTWARKPGYLLLVGDSSWDPRNFMDQGANDFVPTKLIDTNYMETASDDWLVDFTGQGNAAMALGRLPGRTAAEVSLMVSKIMAYEQERELNVPLRGAVMVADSGFETQSAQTSALLPAGVSKQSIDRATIGNDDLMRGQLLDALNQGPMIVNFYGHGSVGVWTAAGVLDSDLADTLTNNNRSSIYLMMTCLNGYAHDAYVDSLSESLLKAPNGGAVAVWASSGFTTPEPQFAMDSQFYRLLFGAQPMRLGEAARQAKLATSDLDVRRTWNLLGDPTMRVR